MRTLAVLVGLAIGLSGCIGGHATTVAPRNDTAEPDVDARDDAADEAPPWTLGGGSAHEGTGASGGDAKREAASGKDADAGDASGDAPGDAGDADGSADPDASSEPPPPAPDSDPVQGVVDEVPAQGANDAGGDVGDVVGEAVSDASDPSVPKDPLAGAGGLVGTVAESLAGVEPTGVL